jgi:TusA-related sulfurtransferase
LNQAVDYTLDFRGAISSITLLELTSLFRDMKIQQMLEMYVSDADTIKDIFKVLPSTLYELVDMKDDSGNYRIRIKKTALTDEK